LLNLTAPVRVAVIDVAGPLADLDCGRAEQPPYTAAWILVCQAGRPLGSIEIALRDPVISAAALEREVRRQLGDGLDRGPQAAPEPPLPLARASVVVPTDLARPAELRRCLKSLAELDHPDYEVIVVDNRPAGAPPADIEGARVVREPRPGASAARNRGASVATGEIVAFTDDDVQAHPGWLSALCRRFARRPRISAVTGLVRSMAPAGAGGDRARLSQVACVSGLGRHRPPRPGRRRRPQPPKPRPGTSRRTVSGRQNTPSRPSPTRTATLIQPVD
jgi:hypothetical protein